MAQDPQGQFAPKLSVPRPSAASAALSISDKTEAEENSVNLESAFANLFKSSVSGTGEEELLRIASNYSLQLSAAQIRCLLYIEHKAATFTLMAKNAPTVKLQQQFEWAAAYLKTFISKWLELKEHNNSDVFVMRALDSISLRKFINENTLKVNIEK